MSTVLGNAAVFSTDFSNQILDEILLLFSDQNPLHAQPTVFHCRVFFFVLFFPTSRSPFSRISCTAASLGSDCFASTLYWLPADKTAGMDRALKSMGTAFSLFLSRLDKGQYSVSSKQWAVRPVLPYIMPTSPPHLVYGGGQRQISCSLKPGVPVCGIIIFSQNTCPRCGSAPVSWRPPTSCALQPASKTDESSLVLKFRNDAWCTRLKKNSVLYRNRYSLMSHINQTRTFYDLRLGSRLSAEPVFSAWC